MNQLQEGKLSHSNNHRFVGVGWITTTGNGYQIKFIPESIGAYSNYTTGSYSLTALSAGTENITPQSGVVLSAADTSFNPTAGSYVNQTVIYTLGTTTSDVYYQVLIQSISVIEANTVSTTPDTTCSISTSTSITYSIRYLYLVYAYQILVKQYSISNKF